MSEGMGEFVSRLTREVIDCGNWALWQRAGEVNRMVGRWLEEKVLEVKCELVAGAVASKSHQ